MLSRLEDLPNELILGILIYFDIRNLYFSFWGINFRFNNLLNSLDNFSFILKQNDLFLDIFASQIKRLKITTSQSIDLSQFLNLNSLELCQANDIQLEQIRSDIMPNLINLSISTPFHISLPFKLIEEIFSNNFRFLKQANLNRLDITQNSLKFQSFSLNSLQITCTNPNVISQILLACPNLLKFSIKFFGQNRHILAPSASNYDHILEEFSLYDPYQKLSFETINILFLYIPNVKNLFLHFLCRIPFIDLIESILYHFKSLETFECEILEIVNNHMIDIDIIQQMNECFFNLQCIQRDNKDRLFFTE